MRFHSGFCLQNDEKFFFHLMHKSDLYVYGFSYGAIKAFEEIKEKLKRFERVDRLVLFSPAFFQTRAQKFKRLQLKAFQNDKETYIKNFIKSCFHPFATQNVILGDASYEDLQKLLEFEWSVSDLIRLRQQGVEIEVYLGDRDRVIDVKGAYDFFKEVADVTFIKEANHFLQQGED